MINPASMLLLLLLFKSRQHCPIPSGCSCKFRALESFCTAILGHSICVSESCECFEVLLLLVLSFW